MSFDFEPQGQYKIRRAAGIEAWDDELHLNVSSANGEMILRCLGVVDRVGRVEQTGVIAPLDLLARIDALPHASILTRTLAAPGTPDPIFGCTNHTDCGRGASEEDVLFYYGQLRNIANAAAERNVPVQWS